MSLKNRLQILLLTTPLLYTLSRCPGPSFIPELTVKIMEAQTSTDTKASSHTPFLEEMSLARSSLRLARESASASARGKAFSWGAERLCWTWDSSKVWVSASRRAVRHTGRTKLKLAARSLFVRAGRDSYLQMGQRWSAGPPRGAGRRRGARDSSSTGRPARHTHTALQSSDTAEGSKES